MDKTKLDPALLPLLLRRQPAPAADAADPAAAADTDADAADSADADAAGQAEVPPCDPMARYAAAKLMLS